MGSDGSLDEEDIRGFLMHDYPRIVAAVRLIAGSEAAAEDAVAEALARAWQRSERGERFGSLPAWVMRVALNLAKSRWRRLRRETSARPGAPAGSLGDGAAEDRVDIERALARLSPREREATVLRYYLGFDVAGAAGVMGVTPGTVKTLLHRARRELALALGEQDLDEENDHAGLR